MFDCACETMVPTAGISELNRYLAELGHGRKVAARPLVLWGRGGADCPTGFRVQGNPPPPWSCLGFRVYGLGLPLPPLELWEREGAAVSRLPN